MSDKPLKRYIFASDFDQTLSFNDSGFVLSELLGIYNFADRISGLSKIHLVQQGGELAYLMGEGREGFERPYGLAWLLQLCAELRHPLHSKPVAQRVQGGS